MRKDLQAANKKIKPQARRKITQRSLKKKSNHLTSKILIVQKRKKAVQKPHPKRTLAARIVTKKGELLPIQKGPLPKRVKLNHPVKRRRAEHPGVRAEGGAQRKWIIMKKRCCQQKKATRILKNLKKIKNLR